MSIVKNKKLFIVITIISLILIAAIWGYFIRQNLIYKMEAQCIEKGTKIFRDQIFQSLNTDNSDRNVIIKEYMNMLSYPKIINPQDVEYKTLFDKWLGEAIRQWQIKLNTNCDVSNIDYFYEVWFWPFKFNLKLK